MDNQREYGGIEFRYRAKGFFRSFADNFFGSKIERFEAVKRKFAIAY